MFRLWSYGVLHSRQTSIATQVTVRNNQYLLQILPKMVTTQPGKWPMKWLQVSIFVR